MVGILSCCAVVVTPTAYSNRLLSGKFREVKMCVFSLPLGVYYLIQWILMHSSYASSDVGSYENIFRVFSSVAFRSVVYSSFNSLVMKTFDELLHLIYCQVEISSSKRAWFDLGNPIKICNVVKGKLSFRSEQ